MTIAWLDRWFCWLFKSRWHIRIAVFCSGMLYPLAFSPFECWPLAFVSVIFLLFAVQKNSPLSAFKIGYYWGLGCFSIGASWVYVSINEFGFVPWYGASALTLCFVAFLALFKGGFAFCCQKLIDYSEYGLIVLIAPSVWVLSELLQSIIFNGFPWLLAGYSQIDSPLSGLVSSLGVYGVSWFLLAISASIILILRASRQLSNWAVLAVLVSVVSSAQFTQQSSSIDANKQLSLDIGLVQPNIAQHQKWDRRFFGEIIQKLFKETEPLWGADLIIWPEGAIPAYAHQVNDILYDLTQMANKNDSHLLLGIPEYDPDTQLSFVALKALGERQQTYHKQILVPFGEYVPLENWLRGLIKFLDLPMSGFSAPLTAQKSMQFEQFSVLPAICYEIVYPSIIRDLALQAEPSNNPQIIVTVSNDAWFGDSFGPYQHMQMARMRAKELGLPLVRSTNDGITAVVNARGEVVQKLARYQQTSLRSSVSLENISTYYRRWGNRGIYMIMLMSLAIVGYAAWKKHSSSKS